MRISVIVAKIKTLTDEELVGFIKSCVNAIEESKRAASTMSAEHRLLYIKPRVRSLTNAIRCGQEELQRRTAI